TGASDIGTNFNWNGPAGFNSAVQNPTISNIAANAGGTYTLLVSTSNCTAAPVTTSITVNSVSLNIQAPALGCSGSSYTLTTMGTASTYTWSTGANTSSIAIAPSTSTVYSVSGTGTNNCVTSASVSISVTNPTISGTGAIACGVPSTATLTAIGFSNSVVNWYPSLTSTVSLATGTNYVPAAASTNTTFYAEANSEFADSLFTLSNGTSSFMGQMFDIVALNSIQLNSFDVNFTGLGTASVEIWYRPGTHVGFETSNTGWTLAQTTTVSTLGSGILTPLNTSLALSIPAGQTYGFYIVSTSGPLTRYSSTTAAVGTVLSQNSDIQLLVGKSGSTYFNVTTSPRSFNGEVQYSIPGCTSPRIPVTLTVNPLPAVTASASTASVCPGNASTLTASGAITYSWTTGSATSTTVVNPNITSTYTVTGSDNSCSNTATVTVNVTAAPSLTLTAAQTTVCVNGPTVSLTGSPAGGVYSGTNVSGNVFTPGATAGTFTPVYSYTDTSTGCSNTTSVSIDVSLCTALDKTSALNGLAVYPNPTAGEFTIELNNATGKTVEVTDLTGRVIVKMVSVKEKINIDLNPYANGVYFVKVQNNDVVEVIKVVKQ
ncbi:MAG: hypothetical protein K0S12_166, partial [Bacteroidetes bacterium]|nr:hypothetical protein [Bacteroidota bacterium]